MRSLYIMTKGRYTDSGEGDVGSLLLGHGGDLDVSMSSNQHLEWTSDYIWNYTQDGNEAYWSEVYCVKRLIRRDGTCV